MDITVDAMAGTLESGDAMVRVSPQARLRVDITSSVMAQYGSAIRDVVDQTLSQFEVSSGHITVEDKGALDCTLRARIEAALTRGSGQDLDWSRR
ncbi:MAG: citrate lyase acyl carrier protein [Propionibacteriaceae bacterium]|jgi:citrate lyase subunit gamma (acyl carrier protein)|nr:citrate lyase acyl carrier protein [Propionibacteriaceae bacterium]